MPEQTRITRLFPSRFARNENQVQRPLEEELLNLVQERSNRATTSFEVFCRMAVDFALRHGPGCRDPLAAPHPWYVLVQLSSAARQDLRAILEGALAAGMERGLVGDAAIADSLEHRRAFWHLRDTLPVVECYERRGIVRRINGNQ